MCEGFPQGGDVETGVNDCWLVVTRFVTACGVWRGSETVSCQSSVRCTDWGQLHLVPGSVRTGDRNRDHFTNNRKE